MRVRDLNSIAVFSITCQLTDLDFIAFYFKLVEFIFDLFTIFIDGQFFECITPLVCIAKYRAISLVAISQQVNRDAARTLAVVVVSIVPDLFNGYLCFLRNMRVGQSRNRSVN